MEQKLIECIPNFSEGRRVEVIKAIVSSIEMVPGVLLLDYSSDPDHNRTVVTFAGNASSVAEAAFSAIATAARLIDLNQHRGSHPRLGATDVVPFVPLGRSTLEECVQIAQMVGQRVGSVLNIPVYMYEAAATCPERQKLENIRRGEFEGLKSSIDVDPNRMPDYGPTVLGNAGATIIGARNPLVAFNVYLDSSNIEIARNIARLVRTSSGGFPHLKALGMLVNGMAQVSMNFTSPIETSLVLVLNAIREAAVAYGVKIRQSELIGLMPQSVLIDVARQCLQLENFDVEHVLEYRLQQIIDKKNILE